MVSIKKTVHKTHERDKEMVEDEVDGYKRRDALARLPHGAKHHLVPAFLRQDLKHRHHTLAHNHTSAALLRW